MINYEIFDALADREMEAFYNYCQNATDENRIAHEIAKQNLIDFAKREVWVKVSETR